MTLLQAIILGIIQGLTEFIPISSTGHLILTQKMMGLDRTLTPQQITAFTAVIQLGTLAAVLVYFFRDLVAITIGFFAGNAAELFGRRDGETRSSSRLGWLIIVGSIPIGIVGLAAKEIIEGALTKNLYLISFSLIFWAFMLLVAEKVGSHQKKMQDIGLKEALVVGLAQVFSLIPGSSRSGTTITGALLVGLNRETAAHFSFLLSIPAIAASGLLELKEALASLGGIGALNLAASTLVSALAGYASIAFLLSYLRSHTTYLFIWYRAILGVLILGLLLAQAVRPN
jgi:undecaprenyl-diphosphatase